MSKFSTLLLIIFFLIFLKRNNDKKFWVIFLYAVLSFASDLFNTFFKYDRFYVFSYFTLIEYTFFSYFFYLSFKERTFKWLVILFSTVFYSVLVYSIKYNYKATLDFDYLSSSFEAVLLIILSIIFFYEQLKNPEIYFIYASKSFWIISAILIYMSATLFLFISTSVLSLNMKDTNAMWHINNMANILKNVLFTIAFCKHLTFSIDSSSEQKSKSNLPLKL